jgi:flagellar hook-associated protein FlgK
MASSNDIPNIVHGSSIDPKPSVSEVENQATGPESLAFNRHVPESASAQSTESLEAREPELIRQPMLARVLRATVGRLAQYQTKLEALEPMTAVDAGDGAVSMHDALKRFQGSLDAVAEHPETQANRIALRQATMQLGEAFSATHLRAKKADARVTERATAMVRQISLKAGKIAQINVQIRSLPKGSEQMSELVGVRDAIIAELAKHIGVQVVAKSDGSVSLHFTNGEELASTDVTSVFSIEKAQNMPDDTLVLAVRDDHGTEGQHKVTSGRLGGLFAAQHEVIAPMLDLLDTVAYQLASKAQVPSNNHDSHTADEDSRTLFEPLHTKDNAGASLRASEALRSHPETFDLGQPGPDLQTLRGVLHVPGLLDTEESLQKAVFQAEQALENATHAARIGIDIESQSMKRLSSFQAQPTHKNLAEELASMTRAAQTLETVGISIRETIGLQDAMTTLLG